MFRLDFWLDEACRFIVHRAKTGLGFRSRLGLPQAITFTAVVPEYGGTVMAGRSGALVVNLNTSKVGGRGLNIGMEVLFSRDTNYRECLTP